MHTISTYPKSEPISARKPSSFMAHKPHDSWQIRTVEGILVRWTNSTHCKHFAIFPAFPSPTVRISTSLYGCSFTSPKPRLLLPLLLLPQIRTVISNKEKPSSLYSSRVFFLVEHRRFELLTPTLPVLCATSCANAPQRIILYHNHCTL